MNIEIRQAEVYFSQNVMFEIGEKNLQDIAKGLVFLICKGLFQNIEKKTNSSLEKQIKVRRGNASDQQMFLAGDQGSAGGAKEMPEVRHTFQRWVQALLTGLWDVALVCTDGGCGNHPGHSCSGCSPAHMPLSVGM